MQEWLQLEEDGNDLILTLLIPADQPLPGDDDMPPADDAPPVDDAQPAGKPGPAANAPATKPDSMPLRQWLATLVPMADPFGYERSSPSQDLRVVTLRMEFDFLRWLAIVGGIVHNHDPLVVQRLFKVPKANLSTNCLGQLEGRGLIGRQGSGAGQRLMWLTADGITRLLELLDLEEAGTLDTPCTAPAQDRCAQPRCIQQRRRHGSPRRPSATVGHPGRRQRRRRRVRFRGPQGCHHRRGHRPRCSSSWPRSKPSWPKSRASATTSIGGSKWWSPRPPPTNA